VKAVNVSHGDPKSFGRKFGVVVTFGTEDGAGVKKIIQMYRMSLITSYARLQPSEHGWACFFSTKNISSTFCQCFFQLRQ
jgi:hypothetical protein